MRIVSPLVQMQWLLLCWKVETPLVVVCSEVEAMMEAEAPLQHVVWVVMIVLVLSIDVRLSWNLV